MGDDMVRESDIDHPFEQQPSVSKEDIEFELRGHGPAPWADFWLNPRRLRGADFLMRWSQGEWSERRLVEAVNGTGDFLCYPYGPSGVAPDDVREYELYFERLEAAGLGKIKRPDLLVFKEHLKAEVEAIIARLGGIEELPFLRED
ncbi:MAG: AccI family restriction endonuclease, partial [Chloroflexota bacterium]|nr:AccI family restriction endonuclease [Chloroflexota bacterium]